METDTQTFTDWIVDSIAGMDDVARSLVVVVREDGAIMYRLFKARDDQALGMVEFTKLAMQHEMTNRWDRDDSE